MGEPETVVQTLIEMTNAAGGKDNVTVVYVEGERFATSERMHFTLPADPVRVAGANRHTKLVWGVIAAVMLSAIGFALARADLWLRFVQPQPGSRVPSSNTQVVNPTESIAAAVELAAPGTEIIVEPGEYRERIFLKNGIRLVSRVPRGAIIRLPSAASDVDSSPAVIADHVSNAVLTGFKIIGDAATPLGVGIGVAGGDLSVIDVEIIGATRAAIDIGEDSSANLLANEIHDNPGSAIFVRSRANPRITNNVFIRNGLSERASGSFVIDAASRTQFERNVFVGLSADVFVTLDPESRLKLDKSNWFLVPREPSARPARPGARGHQSTP
jgi:hypothetical protein